MPPKIQEPLEPSLTIPEFCIAERISEPTYYKLRAAGLGPEELRYLQVVRITYSARREWQKRLQNPTGELAETMRGITARLQAQGRKAASMAVASPQHVSNRRRKRKGS